MLSVPDGVLNRIFEGVATEESWPIFNHRKLYENFLKYGTIMVKSSAPISLEGAPISKEISIKGNASFSNEPITMVYKCTRIKFCYWFIK